MKSSAHQQAFLLLQLLSLSRQLATAFWQGSPPQETCGRSFDGVQNDVDSCERIKVSTYARQFSHQFTVQKASIILNRTSMADSEGETYELGTFDLDEKLGANWTFKVEGPPLGAVSILFNTTFPSNGDDEGNTLNLITGAAEIQIGNNYTTAPFRCKSYQSTQQANNFTTWEGGCFNYFSLEELTEIAQTDSFTIRLDLNLVYENHAQEFENGARCNVLRLGAFYRPRFATSADNNAEFDTEPMEPARQRHRLSVEWSIQSLSHALQEPRGQGLGTTAAATTGWIQEFQMLHGLEGQNGQTLVTLHREPFGKQVSLRVITSLTDPNTQIQSTITSFQLAIRTDPGCTKQVLEDVGSKNKMFDRYKVADFIVTEDDLELWRERGMVVLLEYVLECEMHSSSKTIDV